MKLYRPLKNWIVTQAYGVNKWRFAYGASGHPGLDLRAKFHTPVLAAQGGRVVEVKNDPTFDVYGRYLVIEHEGSLFTLYAHLDRIDVQKGDYVVAGQTIGLSGGDWRRYALRMRRWLFGWKYTAAGYSTAPHLHFEVRLGANEYSNIVNPNNYLLTFHAMVIQKQRWHEAVEAYTLKYGFFQSPDSLEQFIIGQGGNDVAHRLIAFTLKTSGHKDELDKYIAEYLKHNK